MNIFETIYKATHRIERFHSHFLADALTLSLQGDRSLFDTVWELATPSGWKVPSHAMVIAEQTLGGGRRIDVCLRSELPHRRVLGIEVKTVAASAKSGQLEQYLGGLREEYPGYDVQVCYLTPFNRLRAGDASDSLETVRCFDAVCQTLTYCAAHQLARYLKYTLGRQRTLGGNTKSMYAEGFPRGTG